MSRDVPIYIVSKGRWHDNRRKTSKAFERMGVPYRIIVEEQERKEYSAVIDPAKVLVLDPEYQRRYETLDELGDQKSNGPGPARNFAWDHAIQAGAAWHWVVDDNIVSFVRLHQNHKIPVMSDAFFRPMEDFVARYENIAMAGPNYYMFAPRKTKVPAFVVNTRVYSCNLIRNDVPFRWRGRYNEDTILSLEMLKSGWCTVLFNALLQHKRPTQEVKGGNDEAFYQHEGTLPKSQMLCREHPDICRLTWKFGRWHHQCDYRPFKYNRLKLRDDIEIPDEPNEYGMRLVNLAEHSALKTAAD